MPHFPPIVLAVAFAAVVVAVTAIARRLPVPLPIIQVAAGFLVGLLPGVAIPELDPDLVFFVFLPPVLWAAAFFTSLRDFSANRRPIGLLAIGLVLATTAAVAITARMLFPAMPWSVAVALGAIVSPPDAVAAAAIVARLPVPRRVIVILEGESLVNDASALILYRSAIAAAVTGVFSWGESIVRFFVDAGVGVLLGVLVAWVVLRVTRWRRRCSPSRRRTWHGSWPRRCTSRPCWRAWREGSSYGGTSPVPSRRCRGSRTNRCGTSSSSC